MLYPNPSNAEIEQVSVISNEESECFDLVLHDGTRTWNDHSTILNSTK